MNFFMTKKVRLIIPEAALTTIFDECDRFEQDETGGRIVGTFEERWNRLTLRVTGIIESGPEAQRTAISFFQDGKHQEQVFRQIERAHPEIEHLGNWHTHHVNGLPNLSGGDIDTYHRTVNHHNHNTSFFYALLVTAKHRTADPLHRYSMKHYLFRRGDKRIYEIPGRQIEIVDSALVWPTFTAPTESKDRSDSVDLGAQPQRVYDRDVIKEFYEDFRPFASKKLGFFWRGSLELLDSSKVQVVLLEVSTDHGPSYSVTFREPPPVLRGIAKELTTQQFPSARTALLTTERICNRALYQQRHTALESQSFIEG